jgi:DNA processing protein
MSCESCALRGRLLARLGVALDFRARDLRRLWEVLELCDESLIAALGGRRREQLRAWHASPPTDEERQPLPAGVETICRHEERYPRALSSHLLAPRELHVIGGIDRLLETLQGPTVAIVGSRRCTDYGLEMARRLARGISAAGLGLITELSAGIARGAQRGAIEADGPVIALTGGSLDSCSRSCGQLYRPMREHGCLVSELPQRTRPRLWSELGRMRTLALLVDLVVVVEAEDGSRELACAELAGSLGRKLGAVPGRVTSPASAGTNQLLHEGVAVVRTAEDALDLLYDIGSRPGRAAQRSANTEESVEPHLQEVLRMIGEGADTIPKLGQAGRDGLLLELAELELKGIVERGDGGRYVPCAVASCG